MSQQVRAGTPEMGSAPSPKAMMVLSMLASPVQ